MKEHRATPPGSKPGLDPAMPQHRSGAVARMLGMPVATLRVWERRYGVTQPALSASGQRLYSAGDVHRLALLKQLRDLGHAIGSLAGLSLAQLQQVAATHAGAVAGAVAGAPVGAAAGTRAALASPEGGAPSHRPWRVAVVGNALGARLLRPAVRAQLERAGQRGRPVALLGPFVDLAQASASLAASQVDALVIHEAQLQADWPAALQAAAPALAALPKAVLYGFATEPVCRALAAAGTALLREPQTDSVLAQWLQGLCPAVAGPEAGLPAHRRADPPAPAATPRRWDDAALSEFAGLPSTVACECPRHIAEMLMQLSHFEAYSAACANRHAADAALHAYLAQVAASARAGFEAALEQVALHEGLALP